MKFDRLHYSLGAAAVACALSCIGLYVALAASQDEVRKYMAVGAYAFINGQNQVMKAVHEARMRDEQLARYMTPEGLSAYRASLVPQVPGVKVQADELPTVDSAALERVIELASQQTAAGSSASSTSMNRREQP